MFGRKGSHGWQTRNVRAGDRGQGGSKARPGRATCGPRPDDGFVVREEHWRAKQRHGTEYYLRWRRQVVFVACCILWAGVIM